MGARPRTLLALAAGTAALVLPGTLPAASQAIDLPGPVHRLSAAGPRVALVVTERRDCDRVVLWQPATGSRSTVGGTRSCFAGGLSTGGGVSELVLAGRRLAWITYAGGNTRELDLYTKRIGERGATRLASASHDVDSDDGGSYLGNLLGRGSAFSSQARVVWNGWAACVVVSELNELGCDPADLPPGVTPGPDGVALYAQRLRSFDGAARSTLRTGPDALAAVATGGGLLALRTGTRRALDTEGPSPAGTFVVLDASGAPRLAFPAPAGRYRGAVLDRHVLATIRDASLEVYDLENGARLASYPVAAPRGARALELTSLNGGSVAYVSGDTAHVLRLADGRETTVRAGGAVGAVDAELTEHGLFLAYTVRTGGRDRGRALHVPRADLDARLR
jgi:hypothetical protein